jgi:hypothetical protein
MEIIKRKKGLNGFQLLPHRWKVERTFAWLGRHRRMSKDYEKLPQTGEALVHVIMIGLMLRRHAATSRRSCSGRFRPSGQRASGRWGTCRLGFKHPLILDATGCRANLVSIACSQLIRTLDARSRQFTRPQVEQVLRGEDSSPLRDELQYWRSAPLDRALVHAALLHKDDHDAPLRDELVARLKAAGLQPDGRDLDASLERLELGYVLIRGEGGRLRIPVPLLAWLVQEEGDLAEALADDIAEYQRGRAAGATGG